MNPKENTFKNIPVMKRKLITVDLTEIWLDERIDKIF